MEDWVRGQVQELIQELIQELLEEEVTEFLGRAKSARRSESNSGAGYRNGYGRPRRLTLSSGTIQLRRPRVRDTEERFESRLLPLFVHRPKQARGYLERGDDRRAIAACDEAIRRDPTYPASHYNKGLAYLRLQIYQDAVDSFSEAVRWQTQKTLLGEPSAA